MMRPTRLARSTCGLAVASLLIAGCQFSGVNSLDMPGTVGHGKGSFTITVELPNVSSLPAEFPGQSRRRHRGQRLGG